MHTGVVPAYVGNLQEIRVVPRLRIRTRRKTMFQEVTVKKVYKPFTISADGPDEATGEAEA